jgi:hypothetical protein
MDDLFQYLLLEIVSVMPGNIVSDTLVKVWRAISLIVTWLKSDIRFDVRASHLLVVKFHKSQSNVFKTSQDKVVI